MMEYFSFFLLAAYGLVVFVVGFLWDARQHRRGAADVSAEVQAGGMLWDQRTAHALYDQGYEDGKKGVTKTGFFGQLLEKSERHEKK